MFEKASKKDVVILLVLFAIVVAGFSLGIFELPYFLLGILVVFAILVFKGLKK